MELSRSHPASLATNLRGRKRELARPSAFLLMIRTTKAFRIINAVSGEPVANIPAFPTFKSARLHLGHLIGIVPFAMSVGQFKD